MTEATVKHKDAVRGLKLDPELEHGGLSYARTTGVTTDDSLATSADLDDLETDPNSTPLSVEDSQAAPSGRDYIPSKQRILQLRKRRLGNRANGAQAKAKKNKLAGDEILIRETRDYISPEGTSKLIAGREKEILRQAKIIYKKRKGVWKEYRAACKLVEDATDDQRADPSPELRGAMIIANREAPSSYKKEICLAAARIKVLKRGQ